MKGNILILSAGRRVSLVKAFKESVQRAGLNIQIHAGDAKPELSSACCISDSSVQLPYINHADFIPFLLNYCESNNISVIIPTIDTELLMLSKHLNEFSDINTQVLVSDLEFIQKCRNKRLTHQFFEEHQIAVAREMDKKQMTYPAFIKPIDGSSSTHIYYAPEAKYLPPFVLEDDRFMALEYLDRKQHDEYTIDTYYNKEGALCCAVPRKRIETRGGEISKGFTDKNFLVEFVRDKFSSMAGWRGCITMQFFVNTESLKVTGIEINPRFGGGYPLSYLAGADFPLWIIKEYILNENVNWFNDWEDHLLMLRYDDEILIHDFKH